MDALGGVESIDKGGVLYTAVTFAFIKALSATLWLPDEFVYKHETFKIIRSTTGNGNRLRWQDRFFTSGTRITVSTRWTRPVEP